MTAKKPKKKRIGTRESRARRKAASHARGSTSRAEATPAEPAKGTRAAKGERIDWIVERMSRIPDEWNDAARTEFLATFAVSFETMKDDAAIASRLLERTLTDDQLRRKLNLILDESLDELKEIAASARSPFVKAQIFKERRETVQTWADLRGVSAPKKLDVGVHENLAALLAMGLGGSGPPPGAPASPPASTTSSPPAPAPEPPPDPTSGPPAVRAPPEPQSSTAAATPILGAAIPDDDEPERSE